MVMKSYISSKLAMYSRFVGGVDYRLLYGSAYQMCWMFCMKIGVMWLFGW